jgi:hypothetical protein
MERYSFTVEVAGISAEDDCYEDALYQAGCGDALVAVIDGKMRLDFDREASSFEEAVRSVAADIERAGGKIVKVVALPPAEASR